MRHTGGPMNWQTLSYQFKPDPFSKVVGHPMIISEDRATYDLNCSYSSTAVQRLLQAHVCLSTYIQFKADLKRLESSLPWRWYRLRWGAAWDPETQKLKPGSHVLIWHRNGRWSHREPVWRGGSRCQDAWTPGSVLSMWPQVNSPWEDVFSLSRQTSKLLPEPGNKIEAHHSLVR